MSGFKKLEEKGGPKLDLSSFGAPEIAERPLTLEDERIADRVAERNALPGEAVERVQLNRGKKVNDRIFVQGPISTLNRFRRFCNDKDVPLHKGLELLLDAAERG
ncbi:MAG: hypothetical protein IPL18_13675 [Sphingomonadales bacterium]|nr:hypothetical protein [Sphingomonadales bacterium]